MAAGRVGQLIARAERQEEALEFGSGPIPRQVPYTEPTELAMDIMRHGDEVRVVADTGEVAGIVRERVRRAWAAHGEVGT